MWGKLKEWRRRRILAKANLDEQTWRRALRRYPFTRSLSAEEQQRLRELTILFLYDKRFASTHGLQLTDSMRLQVAVQACALILNLGLDCYRGWSEIVVYPAGFVPRHQYTDEMGIVHQGDEPYVGEAWHHGPVILSWADVEHSDASDGVNVVIHEFAHKLDMLNGPANGFPPLPAAMSRQQWSEIFTQAYQDFCARVDNNEPTDIDPYASESPGEFFAVLSEAFFEIPDAVRDEYPEVYEQLSRFYQQDPLRRTHQRAGAAVA